jgi:hypothetical protein
MRTITLWQPWASLIDPTWKVIETRGHDHFAHLKGYRVAFHAGQQFDLDAQEEVCAALGIPPKRMMEMLLGNPDIEILPGLTLRRLAQPKAWPRQCILTTATVEDTRWLTEADTRNALCRTDASRFGLVLTDIRRLDRPVLCAGHQGVWDWKDGR